MRRIVQRGKLVPQRMRGPVLLAADAQLAVVRQGSRPHDGRARLIVVRLGQAYGAVLDHRLQYAFT